jgi:CSLREA domain-containing protein
VPCAAPEFLRYFVVPYGDLNQADKQVPQVVRDIIEPVFQNLVRFEIFSGIEGAGSVNDEPWRSSRGTHTFRPLALFILAQRAANELVACDQKGNPELMILRPLTTIGRSLRHPLLLGAVLLATWCAAPVHAATFVVTSTGDAADAKPGDGVCATGAATPTCTLRAAIQETNALAGADTINVPSGTYFLTIQGASEDAAATGDLDITGELTINGTGTNAPVIGGSGIDRVFDVLGNANLTLSRLTIQNGNPGGSHAAGGGIRNAGNLTLLNLAVRVNTVQNGDGGGIANLGSGRMQLTNVTVSGNVAAARGGGIANDVGGTMQLVNVTLTDNGAFTGGDIDNLGDAELVNTIVANSRQGSNCTGLAILTLGYNIDDGESCGLIAPGDLPDTDPGLGAPTSGTFVYPLVTGSPAIDAGSNAQCPATDQRGAPRPTDGNDDGTFGCDIGAYEAPGPLAFTPTPSPTASPTPLAPTETPTGTPELPTATPTLVAPTVTPGGAAIRLDTAMGSPGDQVTFTATLETGGAMVGSAQNDITFDSSNVLIAALQNGTPDCVKNPDLADKNAGFNFRPNGCTGAICTMVRAFILPTSPPISPIADGSTLYTCSVNISSAAVPGEYPLTVSRVSLSNPLGTPVAGAVGVDGKVVVFARPTETPSPTATETVTATASSTETPTPAATPTVTPIACVGDCNHSGEVTIEEIITMANIALGNSLVSACVAGDVNRDGEITVNEIIAAVNNALNGCPAAAAF